MPALGELPGHHEGYREPDAHGSTEESGADPQVAAEIEDERRRTTWSTSHRGVPDPRRRFGR